MHLSKFLTLVLIPTLPLSAQTLKPIVTQAPGDVDVLVGAPDTVVDLTTVFSIDGVTGPVVRFDTVFGLINVELFEIETPLSVQNFLSYANQMSFDDTVIHRSVPGFVIQGGGFKVPNPPTDSLAHIPTFDPIVNESGLPNTRGTIAMARTDVLNSATSEWYFNTVNNSLLDDLSSPYAVFGRVIGDSILVVDAIARVQPYSYDGFSNVPLISPTIGGLERSDFVIVNSVRSIPMYPSPGEPVSVLSFTASSSNPRLVTVTLENSNARLSFQAGETGISTISVVCSDSDGSKATTSFDIKVSPNLPDILSEPLGRSVQIGGSLTLVIEAEGTGELTYQWRRNGQNLFDKNGQALELSEVASSDSGAYDVVVTDTLGSVTSIQAFVTVVTEMGYLTNLSTRSVTSVEPPFVWTTPGFVTRGSGTIDILARAVGPGLDAFEVAGFLPDPKISLQMLAEPQTVIKINDDWEVNVNLTELKAATLQVGAFELADGSKDSAVFTPIPSDAYTANILSVDGATTGVVLGEVYRVGDPVPGGPALVNLSNRGHVGSDSEVMIGGFAVSGSGPVNLLIRGVGPTLGGFGVAGVLEDPIITVRDKDNVIIGTSDDWEAGELGPALDGIATSVGAFSLDQGSADAALLLVLDPGSYTAVLSGKSGGIGTGLVEIYLVP